MKKPVVFICHSHKDKDSVRNIVKRLNADGIETWFDEVEIKIGESIHQKVNEGLKKSDFFIIVLSRESVKSRWVQEELSSASNIEKYSKRGIFILPLLLEECDVPPLLLDRRYANFKDDSESAYQELLDSIYHHFRETHPEVNLSQIPIPELNDQVLQILAENPEKFSDLPPRHFEELVASLFANMGYDISMTRLTKDGGFDIIAKPLTLPGLASPIILIDCKRIARPVGSTDVRELLGTLIMFGGDKAILVTSSYFTKGAEETARKAQEKALQIDLIDAHILSLMIKQVLMSGKGSIDKKY